MTTGDTSIYVNVTKISVILRDNCSVYNPCGQNGYCRNNLKGEWTCVCKFWWNGILCSRLSGSGKQVIALGVMLVVLIALFHGFTLFHYFQKKRQVEQNRQNTLIHQRKFSTFPVTEVDRTRRRLSWITAIATLILAVSTLVSKWIILKPIHEEIIDKFKNNKPLFFKRHPICRIIDLKQEFNMITFPVACLLILLFAIVTKRVSSERNNWCKGYIGIPIPLDFFAHVKRTFAAVIFAIFADELLDIANQVFSGNGLSSNSGVIVTYILQIVKVLVIGFRRYPILIAVYLDTRFSLICATLYTWLDFSITIVHSGLCRSDFYPTDQNYNNTGGSRAITNLLYYGTGPTLLFIQLLTDIPRYLFLAYISIKLPMLLFKRIRHRNMGDKRLTREQKNLLYSSLPHSAESRYVKNLFGMSNTNVPTNRFVQIARHIYTWRDDFRFSSRVVCVYASIFLLLFFLTVEACVQLPPVLVQLQAICQVLANLLAKVLNSSDPNLQEAEDPSSDFPLPNFVRPYFIAIFTTFIVTIIQLLIMLASIRRNLLQAFRGDDCEIPRRTPSHNVDYATGNFHFAGYLIGYVILAYIFVGLFAMLVAVVIDAFITYGSVRTIETVLKLIIPALLFAFFKTYLNKILGQYVFLQHAGDVLSINNRRAFMVFVYFNFFLDAFLGSIAALIRILKSIVSGMAYMCRLDYSPLGRKLETMDAGFSAYCGFIHMECAHRHPVLLCFVSHLLRNHLYATSTKRLSKARHKWHVAMFLLNNPTLIYRRKGFLTRLHMVEMKMMLIGRKNMKEMYVEQPPILAHRASIISQKDLDELWERRKF